MERYNRPQLGMGPALFNRKRWQLFKLRGKGMSEIGVHPVVFWTIWFGFLAAVVLSVIGCTYSETEREAYADRITEVRCLTGTDTAKGAIEIHGGVNRRLAFITTQGKGVEVQGPCRLEVIE